MSENWDDIAGWWVDAVGDDPTQSEEPLSLLSELIDGTGGRTIDLGCGEGQAMRLLGSSVIGTDLSHDLLKMAVPAGPVVQARLPDMSWIREGSFDRAISDGLIDQIPDHATFFANVANIVRTQGHLVIVMNHPVATAPNSDQLVDPEGEILWRWGDYLTRGVSAQPAGDRIVELFHRPLGELLTAAGQAGWTLIQMIEQGPSDRTIECFPEYRGQESIPSLLGLVWTRN
jgi:SAM-dependent methyltransferase